MKPKHLSAIILTAILSACATRVPASNLVYGLGDDELDFLGRRLEFHVEALGMSEYSFTRGSQVFYVQAHNDLSARDRIRADQPVVLGYRPPGRRPSLESHFPIAQGVTLAAVETHFRAFTRRMDEAGAHDHN